MKTRDDWKRRVLTAVALLSFAFCAGCGYHTGGKAVRLPSDLHTLYVPEFVNSTQTYHVT